LAAEQVGATRCCKTEFTVKGDAASFIGDIPAQYDHGLGPNIFIDYAADISQRAALARPARVLEIAAGTGIVTRRLRDVLPATANLIATDLNSPMLEIARSFGREKV
jgi:predicted O-methyltransferase YrrM